MSQYTGHMTKEVGARIRERRLTAGVTQSDLARALGVDASAVSRIEKGERHLSAFELGVLVDTFGWNARDLLGIARPQKLGVASRLRAMGGSSKDAVARLAALVEVDALLDETGMGDASPGLLFTDLRAAPSSEPSARREGQESAERVREKLRAGYGISDLIGFAETVLGLDVLVTEVPNDCDGAVATGDHVAVAVLDSTVMSGRQRFTLAHEVGHAIMGDVVDTVHIDHNGNDPFVEARADAFAANLLMPADAVQAVLGVRPGPVELVEAMVTFGVSWAALRRRCLDMSIEVSEPLRMLGGSEVFLRAGRGAEESHVAAPIPSRIPARLARRVRDAYSQSLIGAGVVAMAFGVRGEELERLLAGMPADCTLPAPTILVSS